MLSVTFRLVIEWAGRGLRSQHLDIKYSKRQKREMMRAAAGIDPKMPRLCRGGLRKFYSPIDFPSSSIDSPQDKFHLWAWMCCWFDGMWCSNGAGNGEFSRVGGRDTGLRGSCRSPQPSFTCYVRRYRTSKPKKLHFNVNFKLDFRLNHSTRKIHLIFSFLCKFLVFSLEFYSTHTSTHGIFFLLEKKLNRDEKWILRLRFFTHFPRFEEFFRRKSATMMFARSLPTLWSLTYRL